MNKTSGMKTNFHLLMNSSYGAVKTSLLNHTSYASKQKNFKTTIPTVRV